MKRKIAIFTLLLGLMLLTACRNSGPAEKPETTVSGEAGSLEEQESLAESTSPETVPPITDFVLNRDNARDFSIVYSEAGGIRIKDSATALKESIREQKINLSVRVEKNGESLSESRAGIFVGPTSHPSAVSYYETLKVNDYVIAVEGNQIVIVGGSDVATEEAVNDFVQNHLKGFEGEITFPCGVLAFVEKTYPATDIVLCGESVFDYEIVVPDDADAISRYAATLISTRIGNASGVRMKVVQEKNASGKAQIRLSSSTEGLDAEEYSIRQTDAGIEIAATKKTLLYAVREMTDCLMGEEGGLRIDITPEFAEKKKMILTEIALPSSLEGTVPVALCDQKNNAAVVIDLSAKDPTLPEAVLWEWTPTAEKGFVGPGLINQIDEIRLRYSEVLEKYIICVTSSAGFMGIAEYPSGQKIWEVDSVGDNPHSIEYLPNGLVACALSTGGDAVRIYGCDSEGNILPTSVSTQLAGAHAVLWDDEFGVLWALGTTEIVAYEISGTTEAPIITRIEELGCRVKKGHDFSLIPDGNGFYWFAGNEVGVFSKYENAMQTSYAGQSAISSNKVKSVGTLPDGRVIRSKATGVFASHDTDTLTVFTPSEDGTYTKTDCVFPDRAFYKVRPFMLY